MQLSLQSFTSLVQNMAASVQSSATQLLDLTVGSALRAVLEANASIALWMQWLILLVLQTTRASTSIGADLDTWMADFSFVRLPASPASGTVTFARYTPTASARIQVGALVRTADGTQTFAVAASTGNPAFDPAQQAYTIAAGAPGLDVPVVAQVPGTGGNVLAGSISLLVTALQGIDTVGNPQVLTNGIDAESDSAARTRFQQFIDTRSRATPLAVGNAVDGVQQGLNYTLQENVDQTGAPRIGSFVVTVDDGSGAPSATLLASVRSAVDAVRPIGSVFVVQPPQVIAADLELTLQLSPGAVRAPVVGQIAAALAAYVSALPIGATLALTRIAQIAYAASAAVTNVTGLLANAQAADVAAGPSSVIKPGTVTVS